MKTLLLPIYTGVIMDCPLCKAKFELEDTDKPIAITYGGGLVFACCFCGGKIEWEAPKNGQERKP